MTVCTGCGRAGCAVREQFMQATRTEPMKSLGFSGYCPDCQVQFTVKDLNCKLCGSALTAEELTMNGGVVCRAC